MNNSRKKNISKGTTKGKLAAAKKGYFIGSVPPFGYKKWKRPDTAGMNPRILQVDDKTAPAVLDSFEAFAEGDVSYRDIANDLNEQGFLSTLNKPFTRETVRQMLTNPVYIGKIPYGRVGPSVKFLFSGKHQPIISLDLWEQVQLIRSQRSNINQVNKK